jgi:predicted membrane protein
MFAWYGGISIDLRGATLAPDGAHLDLHAVNGGIDITVPEGWNVDSRLQVFAGGVDAPAAEAVEGPTLKLDGFALFGGVAVRAKPAGS